MKIGNWSENRIVKDADSKWTLCEHIAATVNVCVVALLVLAIPISIGVVIWKGMVE